MLKIYRIRPDAQHFQSLAAEKADFPAPHAFDGIPIANDPAPWQSPLIHRVPAELPQADFSGISNCDTFVVPQRIVNKIITFIHQSCELLPIRAEGVDENLYVCHVTQVANCLDKQQSTFDERGRVTKYVFKASRRPRFSLFKLPETRHYETLCWEETDAGPEDDFKSFVETHKLTGLVFEKIWASRR